MRLRTVLLLCSLTALPLQAQTLDDAARMVEAGRAADAKPILLGIIAREPGNARAAYWCGRALLQLNEVDQGVKCLERAVQKDPDRSDYQLWVGRGYGMQAQNASVLRQPGLARKAKSAFERAIALDPSNLDARSNLIDFHLLAPGIMGGDKRKALEQAQEIRRHNGYRGLIELVRVHSGMDNHAAADDAVATMLRSYPDSLSARVSAATYYQGRALWDMAYDAVAPLATRTPPHGGALYQVGRISAVSGKDLERGEAALRRYLTMTPGTTDPSHAAAHWRLGMIMEHRGDRAAARHAYETALRLDPAFAQAKEALKKLK